MKKQSVLLVIVNLQVVKNDGSGYCMSAKKNPELWKNNKQCPVCGSSANPKIFSCETGYDYCSDDCAKQHVKALTPPQGW